MNPTTEPAPSGSTAELRALLRADLVAAMKDRRKDAVSALRTAIAAVDNAEALEAPAEDNETTSSHVAGATAGVGSTDRQRRTLSVTEVRDLLREQVAERLAEADGYETHGQRDAADRLRREAEALTKYVTA